MGWIKRKFTDAKWFFQRLFRGYSDNQVWDLYNHTAEWVLPKLKALRANTISYPFDLTPDQWEEILDKMIYAFENIVKDDFASTKEECDKIQEGCELFGKYFRDLWN